MTIDNRLFLIPAGPFVLLAFSYFFLWIVGAPIDTKQTKEAVVVFSLGVGLVVGAVALRTAFEKELDLGKTRIGKCKESDQ